MKKNTDTSLAISADYRQFIEELKARVLSARISAARAITHEAILLYWDIGCAIVEKEKLLAWGESVIEQVSVDLQPHSPDRLATPHEICTAPGSCISPTAIPQFGCNL